MELQELLNKGAGNVRKEEKLMRLFIDYFEAAFSFKPNCASCTFSKDFRKLQQWANDNKSRPVINIKYKPMESRKYKIKNKFRNTILSYSEDGKTFRMYGYRASDSFIDKFISNSSGNVTKERKSMFDIIGQDLTELTRKELNQIAEEKGIDAKAFKNKAEIVEAIEGEQ